MTDQTPVSARPAQEDWLKGYYFTRAGFSFLWLIAVLTVAPRSPGAAAFLLVCYPAWDALANGIDGWRHGGLTNNPTQLFNAVASGLVAVALAIALPDMHRVLGVFGAWAIVSGLLQLGSAVRRWKLYGAQWAMILSGAQSALAGGFFIFQAQLPAVPTVASLAGYAGFGGFYFLVSGLLLSAGAYRRRRA
ncbi:DUF308 domain-containing protein [Massilia aquatica]|uniref:DUF308 domain-containing protein n=1 Tax=Massilia aquatica TaxID=2609000 RepID=A0ABX0M448_9BURK|nr:DUF308 domain-containing protein [Massilia aquatica]NHZ41954.1 DUF308 domain-containing protein [Massilia aquatica]